MLLQFMNKALFALGSCCIGLLCCVLFTACIVEVLVVATYSGLTSAFCGPCMRHQDETRQVVFELYTRVLFCYKGTDRF